MDNAQDLYEEQRNDNTCSTSGDSSYRLLDHQTTVNGGGAVADVIFWKRWHVSFGVIVFATVLWFLFERSGLSTLSICSDVLLVLVVFRFLLVHYAAFRNKQLQELPELEMSEEMINSAAASFRGKVNYALLMAHDITLGKDFRLFSKMVVFLWLISVIGSYISFFTIAYIGVILSITIPALYDKYRNLVDRIAGSENQKSSSQYRVVDESVNSRVPGSLSKEKDS